MKLIPYRAKKNIKHIGRSAEVQRLQKLLSSKTPHIVVVYGRRRVGKTCLIEHVFGEQRLLKFEGVQGQPQQYQIKNFIEQLSIYANDPYLSQVPCSSWREALRLLVKPLSRGKWTLYLEELQWLASYGTELIAELKYFWDNYFGHNDQLNLILCGSSPSFMIGKVIESKALHNRSMIEVPLAPLSIIETQQFLGPNYTKQDILEAYLCVGGIPEYLRYVREKRSSILQAIAEESFVPGGSFVGEIERVFISSLAERKEYREIINILAESPNSTRQELLKKLGASSSGVITQYIRDLELSGFIAHYLPYNAKQQSTMSRYLISDPYMQFYFKFIQPRLVDIRELRFKRAPLKALVGPDYRIWRGYAFERFLRSQSASIASILGFADVTYLHGAYFWRRPDKAILLPDNRTNLQIDLLFERADRIHTICEIKYTENPTDSSVIQDFESKLAIFSPTKKYAIEKVLISVNGASPALVQKNYFDRIISLEQLWGQWALESG